MKTQVLFSLGLAAGVAYAETGPAGYQRLCANPSTEPVEVGNLKVTNNCDQYAPPFGNYKSEDADTPEACVQLCADKKCPGAAWAGNPSAAKACLLATHTQLPPLQPKPLALFMTYEEKPEGDPFGDDPFGPELTPEQQLENCQNELKSFDKGTMRNAFKHPVCNADNSKIRFTIASNGVSQGWRIKCNKNLRTFTHSAPPAETLYQCMEMCQARSTAKTNKCVAVDWKPSQKLCNMKASGGINDLDNSDFTSAYMAGWL